MGLGWCKSQIYNWEVETTRKTPTPSKVATNKNLQTLKLLRALIAGSYRQQWQVKHTVG